MYDNAYAVLLMFKIIEYPSSVPLENLDVSYKRQNEIIKHLKYLHTAFDGIILSNIETGNTLVPYIVAGSICLFCETLFYTSEDIILIDENNSEGIRTISLTFNIEEKTLVAKIENAFDGAYKEERGNVYYFDEGIIKMYLDFSMFYKDGKYYSKRFIKQEQN